MADVIVTIPKTKWQEWIEEGDLPGEASSGSEYVFWISGPMPNIRQAERVYICAHGKLRGYAPLIRAVPGYGLVRGGDAVACTIPTPITGFRGWRYRWWSRDDEIPFPNWRTP